MQVTILVSSLSHNASADELDTLEESRFLEEILSEMGHQTEIMDFSGDCSEVIRKIRLKTADIVFNLVETIGGISRDIHLVPALLVLSGLPFTGSTSIPMALSTDKVLSKIHLEQAGIKTGKYSCCTDFISNIPFEGPWILKPTSEEASAGIGNSAFHSSIDSLRKTINSSPVSGEPEAWFVEKYIDGREFNIGLVPDRKDWIIFEPAEIVFNGYAADKPKILDWRAKWDTNSFEYMNTIRSFDFNSFDPGLSNRLKIIAKETAVALRLDGYSRVDFRMDHAGELYVLEANANPCISPDAGFIAACDQSGYSRAFIFEKILQQALYNLRSNSKQV
ncbi:hypothetical protein KKF34_06620 [Myxococcota bacterium]|nr:hypothetical protein [Myxococcota bacterium]MBU1381110.1 hypothetical protein [Myxococcota bacterium]MBU1496533.1 hypothetical protein [Myxococcota bacterium]